MGASSDPIQTRELSANKLKVGVGQTPVTTQASYTQTYSTAAKSVANPTATAVGDLGNGASGASSTGNFDKIEVAIDALIADNLDLRKAVTAIIDDLQAFGLAG